MAVIRFFQDGGAFMWPILIILGLGLAVALERYFYLSKTTRSVKKTWKQLSPMLQAQDYHNAQKLTASTRSPLAKMLNYGFARKTAQAKRETIESAMMEGVMEVMPELEERTPYLATFANIATLLGLLGTIIGLINAFTAVANADPAAKADLLSASISLAMNTTAFGLIAAIPLILLHSFLAAKTAKLVDALEMSAVKCLNLMDVQAAA